MKTVKIIKGWKLKKVVFTVMIFTVCLEFFISGCATVKVPIPVTHPAEINMNAYKTIAVSHIDGPIGSEVSDGIKERLVEGNRFKVIDPAYLNQILDNLHMSGSDLFDQDKRVSLGKLLPATVLIVGHTKADNNEKHFHEASTCSQSYNCGDQICYRSVPCTLYWCETTVHAYAGLEVIDVSTGSLLRSKQLPYTKVVDSQKITEGMPACPDASSVVGGGTNYIVSTFIKSIQPWTEMVSVPFLKDGDIPELETGIKYATAGQMDEANKQFSSAVKNAENNPKLKPSVIARAYWDLGLSYEYSDQFDNAIESFKSAFKYDSSEDKYLKEENHVKARKKEYEKLQEQQSEK